MLRTLLNVKSKKEVKKSLLKLSEDGGHLDRSSWGVVYTFEGKN